MSNMKILECVCENSYQDKRFGNRRRAMNPLAKERAFRCTVCNRVHSSGAAEDEKVKK